MVQGVSSWAGKSLLTTALARAFRRRGIDVAPFKAQTVEQRPRRGGGDIGTAHTCKPWPPESSRTSG